MTVETQTLLTLQRNVQWTGFLSTPGVLVAAYDDDGRRFLRPVTDDEAAVLRPRYEEYAAELSRRDPEGYAAWLAAFTAWRAGDLTKDMPRPENYTGGDAPAVRVDLKNQLLALDAQYEQITGNSAFLYAEGPNPGAFHFAGRRVVYGVRSALAHMKTLLHEAAEEMEGSA